MSPFCDLAWPQVTGYQTPFFPRLPPADRIQANLERYRMFASNRATNHRRRAAKEHDHSVKKKEQLTTLDWSAPMSLNLQHLVGFDCACQDPTFALFLFIRSST